jgi:hypothetical protein
MSAPLPDESQGKQSNHSKPVDQCIRIGVWPAVATALHPTNSPTCAAVALQEGSTSLPVWGSS